MLHLLITVAVQHWLALLPLLFIAYLVKNRFNRKLHRYPGPFLASLTDWWRFFDVLGRRPEVTLINLHKQYGDVVRLGPNALSFADPSALKVIYGLNRGFIKACVVSVPLAAHANTPVVGFLSRPASHGERYAFAVFVLYYG